jgi:hypothetical protein
MNTLKVKLLGNLMMVHSEWERIALGVLQESILGPLLFLLYIDDFPRTLNNISIRVLFADDSSYHNE